VSNSGDATELDTENQLVSADLKTKIKEVENAELSIAPCYLNEKREIYSPPQKLSTYRIKKYSGTNQEIVSKNFFLGYSSNPIDENSEIAGRKKSIKSLVFGILCCVSVLLGIAILYFESLFGLLFLFLSIPFGIISLFHGVDALFDAKDKRTRMLAIFGIFFVLLAFVSFVLLSNL